MKTMHGRVWWLAVATAVLVFSTLCAVQCFAYNPGDPEFRGFWVDAWGAGAMSQSEVDNLLGVPGTSSTGQIRDANCNAIILQVRRNCDANYPSSMGEPYMSGLTPSDFNALQAVINAAHDTTGGKKRIEVHAWMVTFRTSGGTVYGNHDDPPTGSLTTLDNYWPSLDNTGAEVSDKAFDPGHPLAEDYTVNVAMDIVNHFDVDGIHFDYIRFTANNQGYNPTSLARYNARYGTAGQPAYTDAQWQQWRRDQVTAVVRKVYAKTQASKPNVKVSGSFVTWNPSPTASTRDAFMNTRPYYDVYSDWDSWMQEGIVDAAVPMTYYDYSSLPSDWTRWINFEKERHFNRHMYIGPGIYLNSDSDAITEILQTRDRSPGGGYAQGFSGYSYRTPFSGGTWAQFEPELFSQVTGTSAPVPTMPWKTSPTKGHISGTVTYAIDGKWADGATVSITGPESRSMLCDGTGFYAFIDLTPGAYTVTASKTGYTNAVSTVNVTIGGTTGNMYVSNLILGGTPAPTIWNVQASPGTTSATVTWNTDQASSSQVQYGLTTSYGSSTTLDSTATTSHSQVLTGLITGNVYHYRVISTNASGATTSGDYTFTTSGPPTISGVQVTNIGPTSATVTWTTSVAADSKVNYGLTSSYGLQASNASLVTSHSVSLYGLTPTTGYHYQVVSTTSSGTATSADYTFTTTAMPTELIVDDSAATLSGSWTSVTGSGYGNGYRYCNRRSPANKTCTWTPNITVAGLYSVYVIYPLATTPSTNSTFTVTYNGGTTSKAFNQTTNTNTWNLIAANLPFAAGTGGNVVLNNSTGESATTRVVADAVKFVYVGPIPPADVIVDDADAAATSTGTWTAGTYSGGYNNTYKYAGSDVTNTASFTWTPTIARTGLYDLYCWYTSGGNRPTNAAYDIHYYGGTQTATVNQTTGGSSWVLLAPGLRFNAGTSGCVTLTNKTGATGQAVIADAIKWVYSGDVKDTNPPTLSLSAPSTTITRGGPVSYTVSYSDDSAVSAITLALADISLNRTGTANGIVSISGTGNSTRTVTISNITGDGNLGISIASGTASDDSANAAHAVGPSTMFGVDNTAPSISISAPSVVNTIGGPVTYTVTYSGADSVTLNSSHIVLNKTGPVASYIQVSGTGSTRTVTLSTINGVGALGISIVAGTASDIAGNVAPVGGPSTTFVVDKTSPMMTTVGDDTYTLATDSLYATWVGSDAESGVQRFEYAVGTDTGANINSVRNWTDAGTAGSASITGLSLTVGQTYYISVRATNNVGLTCQPMSSAGVTVAYPADTVLAAKALNNDKPVGLPATSDLPTAYVVSAVFPNYFYLEDNNRVTGIRVQATTNTVVGQNARVFGVLGLTDDGERAILNPKVITQSMGTQVSPFAIVGSFIGGQNLGFTPGITNGKGLNNVGLLVKIAGKVTKDVADGFYVDDGAGATDDTGYTGIKVLTGPLAHGYEGSYVVVTGVVSCRKAGSTVYPQILATSFATY